MSLHYTKSGALDMRYSSSKAAVSSGYGSGGGYASYGGGGSRSSSSDLHYTKSGALDMRYSSSKAAVASGRGGGNSRSRSTASDLHYTKSGALDMRYNSSKAVVAEAAAPSAPVNSNLHYTKSGTLDMRYKSSQAVAKQLKQFTTPVPSPAPSNNQLHYTKRGALDMRYKSSREVAQRMAKMGLNGDGSTTKNSTRKAAKPPRRLKGVPRDLPVTKAGTPDLRTTRAKQWVQNQAQLWHPADALPVWVPSLKDGSPDMTKAVSRHFIGGSPALLQQDKRVEYYENKRLHDRFPTRARNSNGAELATLYRHFGCCCLGTAAMHL
ncbi:hypothetical protein V7S43_009374 [Phytophthora oleae]|uniref:Uncharacterized protein n=1 Tax=Phytophthora oleae TaxID=2107226 RepID=A0ABD3FIF2_9STRA